MFNTDGRWEPPSHASRLPFCRAYLTTILTAATLLLLQLTSVGAAQDQGLSGSFSVSYAFALDGTWSAANQQVNQGLVARADLSYEADGKLATLTLDPLGLRSRSASFEVREASELFSIDYSNTPADGLDPDRGDITEVQALVVARQDGAPAVQALLNSQSVAGANGNSSLIARIGLSDRYRDPFSGVSSLDWRASLQTTSLLVTASDSSRNAFSTSFGVSMAFGGERSRSLRPKVDVTWRNGVVEAAAGRSAEQNLRLRTGIGIDASQFETLNLGADWEFEHEAAWSTRDRQSLNVRSTRLAPLNLALTLSRASSAVEQSYAWGLSGDSKLTEALSVGLGYRGESGGSGNGHGVTGSLAARWASTAVTVRSSLEAGAMWRSDGTFSPDAAFSLAVATPSDSDFGLTVAASLKYDERLAAALNASGSADLGRLQLSFDTELGYAGALKLSAGATAAVDLIDLADKRLGLQLGIEARSTAGGSSAAAIDLGLRYAFGERR